MHHRRARSDRWWPALVAVVAVLMGIAWVARADEPPPGPPGVPCAVVGTKLRLTPSQAANVETIATVARKRDLHPRAVVIALATAQQESRLRNLPYGDRDSLGLFQQRPSQGWGSPAQVQDPVYAAGKFFDGLVQVPGWESGRLTSVADAVQRSAYPLAYGKHQAMAEDLAAALLSDDAGAIDCRYSPPDVREVSDAQAAAVASVVDRELGGGRAAAGTGQVVVRDADWPAAHWSVAQAERLQAQSVSFNGWTWDSGTGWARSDVAPGPDLVVHLVR